MTGQKGQRVGYIRVSTADHHTARQLDGVDVERAFTDHASGKDTSRPQLAEALRNVPKGDTLVVHSRTDWLGPFRACVGWSMN